MSMKTKQYPTYNISHWKSDIRANRDFDIIFDLVKDSDSYRIKGIRFKRKKT